MIVYSRENDAIITYKLCDQYGFLSMTYPSFVIIAFYPFTFFKFLFFFFEYLENKKFTLRSCLLINHLWCEIAVRILWRNVWNYCFLNFRITLIACLPNKSKEILCMGGINISAPTSKPLMFNYAKFCKVLSIN